MLSFLNPFLPQNLPQAFNQTDRIQGMARYMNQEGANSELMTLLLIFAGMLSVILLLRALASRSRKKEQAAKHKKAKSRRS